ncbi:hypothetical protein CC78DRAFT_534078 [Lojkania enalia]|uniref:Rhodopsin domain-containing protein n=1 Tax=Lojkania enalia TaxID=147567 RepID=A0A9P4K5L0_9PLEO|nr:hypothetical protein CC78DRAFT_534078 [Didymosphaeria enalia]
MINSIANIQPAREQEHVYDGDGIGGEKVVLAVEIPLIILAISVVGLRVYSRLAVKRKLAVDDVLIVLGCSCAFARTVISCMSVDDIWGFDAEGPDRVQEVPYYKHIFERRIAYIFAVSFTRCSVLAYYLRIFPPGLTGLRRWCWVLLFLALAQFVEVFTVLIVFCKDIGKLWTSDFLDFRGSRCFSSPVYSYSAAIGDSVLDSVIFALPIPYVWKLTKLRTRQRVGLIIIFALGFTVCVVALLQIPFIKRREEMPSYFGTAINMLIAIQLALAIAAASLPDIRALIARSFPKFSPLHHRSLVTATNNQDPDAEQGALGHNDTPRQAFEGRRHFRKPDWMRSTLPASLLSTRIRHDDASDEAHAPPSSQQAIGRRKSSIVLPWITQNEAQDEDVPLPGRSSGRRPSLAQVLQSSTPPARTTTPVPPVPEIHEAKSPIHLQPPP